MFNPQVFWSLIATSLGFVVATSAYAESELQLNIPYYIFDDQPLEDEVGIGLGYGYRFDNPFGVELSYTEVGTEFSDFGGDLDIEHWQLNGLYHFAGGEKLQPFAMLGIGNMNFDVGGFGGDDDTLASTVGLGAKYDLTRVGGCAATRVGSIPIQAPPISMP